MSIIGRLRSAIITSLFLLLVVAIFSGIPILDPFTNHFKDHENINYSHSPTLFSRLAGTSFFHQTRETTQKLLSLIPLQPETAQINSLEERIVRTTQYNYKPSTKQVTDRPSKEKSSKDSDDSPPPVSGKDLREEVYKELNTKEDGETEKYRYGYQLTEEDTYRDNGGEIANDGQGVISGTYIAPDGSRHTIAVTDTIKASGKWADAVNQKIASISDEELELSAQKTGTTKQETLNKILEDALISDQASRNEIIEIREKSQETLKEINNLYQQAIRLIDEEAWRAECLSDKEGNITQQELTSHCDQKLVEAKRAFTTLSTEGPEDDKNPYYSKDLVKALDATIQAVKSGYSGYNDYTSSLDKITDENLRSYAVGLVSAHHANTLSESLVSCEQISAPDVRNACLSRYANENEQQFYSYDGTITKRTTTPTIQQTYEDKGLITSEIKSKLNTVIKDRVVTSELSYLINQQDLERTSSSYKPVSTASKDSTSISSQLDSLLDLLDPDNPQRDIFNCRKDANKVYIPSTSPNTPGECRAATPQVASVETLAGKPGGTLITATEYTKDSCQYGLDPSYPATDGNYLCAGAPDDTLTLTSKEKEGLTPQEQLKKDKVDTLATVAYEKFENTTYSPDEFRAYLANLATLNGLSYSDTFNSYTTEARTNTNCDGAVIYSVADKSHICLSAQTITAHYLATNVVKTEKRGELGSKCTALFMSCHGDSLSCNRTTKTCELSEVALYDEAQDLVANSDSSAGLTDEEMIALNFSLQFASPETQTLMTSTKLEIPDASGVKQDDTFFANSTCWQAVDPTYNSVRELPLDYCLASKKQTLLPTLPGRDCHAAGGYYAKGLDSTKSTHKGIPDCYLNTNPDLAGLGQKYDSPGSKLWLERVGCAPGLKPDKDDICRESISLAFDPDYAGGVFASAIKTNWGDTVPILGHIPDLITTFVGSAIRSLSPSYNTSISARAEYNLETREGLSKLGDSSINFSKISSELTNTLDQSTAARESALTAKDLSEQTNDPTKKRNYMIYRAGVSAWQVISAWTGEPPISRGGAAGTNAFYEYAEKSSELNAQGEDQYTWNRIKAAGKPTYQAAFVAGDVIPGVAGLGRLITKSGVTASSATLKTVGLILEAPEKILVSASRKSVGGLTVLPATKLLKAGGGKIAQTAGFQTLKASTTRTFGILGEVFSPIARFTDETFRGLSQKSSYNKLIKDSIDKVAKETIDSNLDEGIEAFTKRIQATAEELAVGSGNQQIASKTDNEVRALIAKYMPDNSSLQALTKHGGSITSDSIRASKFVEKWKLTIPPDDFPEFASKLKELDTIALTSGPLSEEDIIKHFAGNLDQSTASWVAAAGSSGNEVWATNNRLFTSKPKPLSVDEFATRLKQAGYTADKALDLARTIDSPLVNNQPSKIATFFDRFRSPSTTSAVIPETTTSLGKSLEKELTPLIQEGQTIDDVVDSLLTNDGRTTLIKDAKSASSITSSVNPYRLKTPPNVSDELIKAIDDANNLLTDLEDILKYTVDLDQARLVFGEDGLKAMQAGGGKTAVVMRVLGVKDGRGFATFETTTTALEHINEQILKSDSTRAYYKKNLKGNNIVYLDSEKGLLRVNLDNSIPFTLEGAEKVSEKEIISMLELAATGEQGIYIMSNADSPVWELIRQQQKLGKSGWLTDLLGGQYNDFTFLTDELNLAKQLSVTDGKVALSKLTDPSMLSGLDDGVTALSTFQEVRAGKTISSDHKKILDAFDAFKAGANTNEIITKYGDHYLPTDITTEIDSYLDIVEQTRKKFSKALDNNQALSQELERVNSLLTSANSQTTREEAITELHSLLTSHSDEVITDLSYRKSSLQSIWDQWGSTPDTHYALEKGQLVIREAGGSTTKTHSLITQQLALNTEGLDILKVIGQVDDSLSLSLADIAVSPKGNSMSMKDFYAEILNSSGNHKFYGLDATPDGPAHILGLLPDRETEKLATHLIKNPTNYTTSDDLIKEIFSNAKSNKAQIIVFNDEGLVFNQFGDQLSSKFVKRDEVFVAKLRQTGASGTVEEFLHNGKVLKGKSEWDELIHANLKSNPEKTLVFVQGRARALDLSVNLDNLSLEWSQVAMRKGTEGNKIILDELIQGSKRNRLLVERNRNTLINELIETRGLSQVDAVQLVDEASRFNLYSHVDNGLGGTVDDIARTLESGKNAKLAELRLQTALSDLASSPKKALANLKRAQEDIIKETAWFRRPSTSNKLDDIIKQAEKEASAIEAFYASETSRTPLVGDKLYQEVYARAEKANQQLLDIYAKLDNQLALNSSNQLLIKDTLGISTPLMSYDDFIAGLKSPTTTLTKSLDSTPGKIIDNFVANNTLDPNATNSPFRLADESYIQSTTPPTHTAPTTLERTSLADILNPTKPTDIVSAVSSRLTELDSLIPPILLPATSDTSSLVSTLLTAPSRIYKAFTTPQSPSVDPSFTATRSDGFTTPTSDSSIPAPILSPLAIRVANGIGKIWGSITPIPDTPAKISDTPDVVSPTTTSNPTLNGQSITALLKQDNFDTLAFNFADGTTSVIYLVGDELFFVHEQDAPIPLTTDEEIIAHLPSTDNLTEVRLNNETVDPITYQPLIVDTTDFEDLAWTNTNFHSSTRFYLTQHKPVFKLAEVSAYYTPTLLLIHDDIDPTRLFLYDADENIPLETVISLNHQTHTLKDLVDKDRQISLTLGDTVQFGNTVFNIIEDLSDANNRKTAVRYATSPSPTDPEFQLSQAHALEGDARRQAYADLQSTLTTRYQELENLQQLLIEYIEDNPDFSASDLIAHTTTITKSMHFSPTELNYLYFTLNDLAGKAKRVRQIKNSLTWRNNPNQLWKDAFFYAPYEDVVAKYDTFGITFIAESDDFDQVYSKDGTVTSEALTLGFHQVVSTGIQNTENIFNVARNRSDQVSLAGTIAHEIEHGLNKAYQQAFQTDSFTIHEDTSREKIIKRLFALSKQEQYSDYELSEINSLPHTYQWINRREAEIEVADEILARLTGYEESFEDKTTHNWLETKKQIRSNIHNIESYQFIENSFGDDSALNLMQSDPSNKEFTTALTRGIFNAGKLYTSSAQDALVTRGLEAYQLLRSKGYSHQLASLMLQTNRLSSWSAIARRAEILDYSVNIYRPQLAPFSTRLIDFGRRAIQGFIGLYTNPNSEKGQLGIPIPRLFSNSNDNLQRQFINNETFNINQDTNLTIGRDNNNSLHISQVTDLKGIISNNHARIYFDSNSQSWVINDLDSTNGTFINESTTPISSSQITPLNNGDVVHFSENGYLRLKITINSDDKSLQITTRTQTSEKYQFSVPHPDSSLDPQASIGIETSNIGNYIMDDQYGYPPNNLNVVRDPKQLYNFQKNIVDAARNHELNKQFLLNSLRALREKGVNVHILSAKEMEEKFGPKVGGISSDSTHITTNFWGKEISKEVVDIHIADIAGYSQIFNIPEEQALIIMAQKIGHEGGHALDSLELGLTKGKANLWATEYRQKYFNYLFYQSAGQENMAKQYKQFTNDVESYSRISYNQTTPLDFSSSPDRSGTAGIIANPETTEILYNAVESISIWFQNIFGANRLNPYQINKIINTGNYQEIISNDLGLQQYIILNDAHSIMGGIGMIVQGYDISSGQLVAIKQPLPEDLQSNQIDKYLQIIKEEATSLSKLDHPNIPKFHGLYINQLGIPVLVTEWVNGSTLQEDFDVSEKTSLKEAVDTFTPIAQALDHAHSQGVIHGDIKLANIIDKHLVDWGDGEGNSYDDIYDLSVWIYYSLTGGYPTIQNNYKNPSQLSLDLTSAQLQELDKIFYSIYFEGASYNSATELLESFSQIIQPSLLPTVGFPQRLEVSTGQSLTTVSIPALIPAAGIAQGLGVSTGQSLLTTITPWITPLLPTLPELTNQVRTWLDNLSLIHTTLSTRYQSYQLNRLRNRVNTRISDVEFDLLIDKIKLEANAHQLLNLLIDSRLLIFNPSSDDNRRIDNIISTLQLSHLVSSNNPTINPVDIIRPLVLDGFDPINQEDLLNYKEDLSTLMGLTAHEHHAINTLSSLSHPDVDTESAITNLIPIYSMLKQHNLNFFALYLIGDPLSTDIMQTINNNLSTINSILETATHKPSLLSKPSIENDNLILSLRNTLTQPNATKRLVEIKNNLPQLISLSQQLNQDKNIFSGDLIYAGIESDNLPALITQMANLSPDQLNQVVSLLYNAYNLVFQYPHPKTSLIINEHVVATLKTLSSSTSINQAITSLQGFIDQSSAVTITLRDDYYLSTLEILNDENVENLSNIFDYLVTELNYSAEMYHNALQVYKSMDNDTQFRQWVNQVAQSKRPSFILLWSSNDPLLAEQTTESTLYLEQTYNIDPNDFFPSKRRSSINFDTYGNLVLPFTQLELINFVENIKSLSKNLSNYPGESGELIIGEILKLDNPLEIARHMAARPFVYRSLFNDKDTVESVFGKIHVLLDSDNPLTGLRQVRSNLLSTALEKHSSFTTVPIENLTPSLTYQLINLLEGYGRSQWRLRQWLSSEYHEGLITLLTEMFPDADSDLLEILLAESVHDSKFLTYIINFRHQLSPLINNNDFLPNRTYNIIVNGIYEYLKSDYSRWSNQEVSKHTAVAINQLSSISFNSVSDPFDTTMITYLLNTTPTPDLTNIAHLINNNYILADEIIKIVTHISLEGVETFDTIIHTLNNFTPPEQPSSPEGKSAIMTNYITTELGIKSGMKYKDLRSHYNLDSDSFTSALTPNLQAFLNATAKLPSLEHYLIKTRTDGWTYFQENLANLQTEPLIAKILSDSLTANKQDEVWKVIGDSIKLRDLVSEIIPHLPQEQQDYWQAYLNNSHLQNSLGKPDGYDFFQKNLIGKSDEDMTAITLSAETSQGSKFSNIWIRFSDHISSTVLDKLPSSQNKFWQAYSSIESAETRYFLSESYQNIDSYWEDNHFTPTFYQDYAQKYPNDFLRFISRKELAFVVGDEAVKNLLASLPKGQADEARNAFTHNKYDRTSEFFATLINQNSTNFTFSQDNMEIVTTYITQFGLSPTPTLYQHFFHLYSFENGKTAELPQEVIDSGITSIAELSNRFNQMKNQLFSTTPTTGFDNLSSIEEEIVSLVTKHSVHKFTKFPISRIVSSYKQDLENGNVTTTTPGHYPQTAEIPLVNYDTEGITSENDSYPTISLEILNNLENPENISVIKPQIISILQEKLAELQIILSTKPGAEKYITKEINQINDFTQLVENSDDLDQLIGTMTTLNTKPFGANKQVLRSLYRQLMFRKLFTHSQRSSEWIEQVRSLLTEPASMQALSEVITIIDIQIKDHMLNIKNENADGYWTAETYDLLKRYKKRNNITEYFLTYLDPLRETLANLQQNMSELNTHLAIEMIPDKGLIGEMTGYCGGVCYTKVFPLLSQNPNLTPYKFVTTDPVTGTRELIGSALVFKVKLADERDAFVIRAFDVPDEASMDIAKLFEEFANHLRTIAEEENVSKILVAGTGGTVSNYPIISNYVFSTYKTNKPSAQIKDRFDFNGYDITNNLYEVTNGIVEITNKEVAISAINKLIGGDSEYKDWLTRIPKFLEKHDGFWKVYLHQDYQGEVIGFSITSTNPEMLETWNDKFQKNRWLDHQIDTSKSAQLGYYYIGRDYRLRGYGTKGIEQLSNQLATAGIDTVYAFTKYPRSLQFYLDRIKATLLGNIQKDKYTRSYFYWNIADKLGVDPNTSPFIIHSTSQYIMNNATAPVPAISGTTQISTTPWDTPAEPDTSSTYVGASFFPFLSAQFFTDLQTRRLPINLFPQYYNNSGNLEVPPQLAFSYLRDLISPSPLPQPSQQLNPLKKVKLHGQEFQIPQEETIENIVQFVDQVISATYKDGQRLPGCRVKLCTQAAQLLHTLAAASDNWQVDTHELRDLNFKRNIAEQHSFFGHEVVILTNIASQEQYIVDLTFSQFIDPDTNTISYHNLQGSIPVNNDLDQRLRDERVARGVKLDVDTGINYAQNLTARTLMETGFIPFSELTNYLNLTVSPESIASAYDASDTDYWTNTYDQLATTDPYNNEESQIEAISAINEYVLGAITSAGTTPLPDKKSLLDRTILAIKNPEMLSELLIGLGITTTIGATLSIIDSTTAIPTETILTTMSNTSIGGQQILIFIRYINNALMGIVFFSGAIILPTFALFHYKKWPLPRPLQIIESTFDKFMAAIENIITQILKPTTISELLASITMIGLELYNDIRLFAHTGKYASWGLISRSVGESIIDPAYGDIFEISAGHIILRSGLLVVNKILTKESLIKLVGRHQIPDTVAFWTSLVTVVAIKATHSLGYISLFGIHDHMDNPVPEMLAGQAVASAVLITTHYLAKYHKHIISLVITIGKKIINAANLLTQSFKLFLNKAVTNNAAKRLANNITSIIMVIGLSSFLIWAIYSFFSFVTGPPPSP